MKPTKIYAKHLEATALEQFELAMAQPFSVKGALMPDAHTGYTLPIGAVVATDGVILPSWVGYDIGCGMCAVPTTFDPFWIAENADTIFAEIYKHVPVGFNVNKHPVVGTGLSRDGLSDLGKIAFDKRKGLKGIGTLGGGNHFIEIGTDENEVVWIIVHSGSRGVGHGIATEFIRMASGDGKVREGHFGLAAGSDAGKAYINDQSWCLEYALRNRLHIVDRVINAINETGVKGETTRIIDLINRNHNHAELKDGLWVHRKGATHAELGMMGVIPGNMRDGTFIVRGKGNPDSLCSSSHGAGRVMGRKQAKRELDVAAFQKTMVGVTAKVEASTLDEAPMAYKDIFEVMELQKDLVEVVHHITPIINIKG